ncbi:SOS response-associated peptidase [Qipengyuania sediminis]|uniref:SOS response-associated peptidase n=1 Tax=Qipengyuania sediminis TaxID=1532023 RepID=UPI00105A5AD0|nr:SOS response-associated peptidase family protein [Qipengyuania sediminis]
MCNLYRMTKSVGEVARWFEAEDLAAGANFASEVYPGYPGLVVAEGTARVMTWGFPLALKGAKGQMLKPRPVNNARTDKLAGPFWRDSFAKRRCVIPLTAWAEAEGERGAMTCTWLTRPDVALFAAAGVWRMSAEWGAVYSMVMTDSCGAAAECHDRMPVLLSDSDWDRWTSGAPEDAMQLCVPFGGEVTLDRTTDRWGKPSASPEPQPSLL